MGIAAGTLIVIVAYHAVRPFARPWPDHLQAGGDAHADTAVIPGGVPKSLGEVPATRPGGEPHPPGTGQPVPTEDGPGGLPDPGA
jgi:hypothetical protein